MSAHRRKKYVLLAVAVAVSVAIAGVAYASIPDSSGAIHGCYSPNGAKATNGTPLNIIDASASCSKGQAAVTWSGLPQTCASGQTPQQSGSGWTCATYAGSGQSCDSGKVVTGIDGQGRLVCAYPVPPKLYESAEQYFNFEKASEKHTVGTITIPTAGNYLVQARVFVNANETTLQCELHDAGGQIDYIPIGNDGAFDTGFGLTSFLEAKTSAFAGETFSVVCLSTTDDLAEVAAKFEVLEVTP